MQSLLLVQCSNNDIQMDKEFERMCRQTIECNANKPNLPSGVYYKPTKWPAPSWLVISGCRALQRYCRDHGFKSRTGLNFFSGFYFHYCFSNVHYREDHFHLHLLFRSSNKLYDFHMFIVLFSSCSIVLLHVRQVPINKFWNLTDIV